MATHSLSTLVGDDEGDARVEAKSVRAELQGLALPRSVLSVSQEQETRLTRSGTKHCSRLAETEKPAVKCNLKFCLKKKTN